MALHIAAEKDQSTGTHALDAWGDCSRSQGCSPAAPAGRYTGGWLDDLKHGDASEHWADGSRFEGARGCTTPA